MVANKEFNQVQVEVFRTMENRVLINNFTPIQALTMVLSYYKGGYYEGTTDSEMEMVVKAFVEKYMK